MQPVRASREQHPGWVHQARLEGSLIYKGCTYVHYYIYTIYTAAESDITRCVLCIELCPNPAASQRIVLRLVTRSAAAARATCGESWRWPWHKRRFLAHCVILEVAKNVSKIARAQNVIETRRRVVERAVWQVCPVCSVCSVASATLTVIQQVYRGT